MEAALEVLGVAQAALPAGWEVDMSCKLLDTTVPRNGVVDAGDEPRNPAAKTNSHGARAHNSGLHAAEDKTAGDGTQVDTGQLVESMRNIEEVVEAEGS